MKRLAQLLAIGACAVLPGAVPQQSAHADVIPRFQPEPFWPKPLPENWILGQVSGIGGGRDDPIMIVDSPL